MDNIYPFRSVLLVAACVGALPGAPFAQENRPFVSDATRLGAFSGAMRYCEGRYGGSDRRYRYARLRVASVIDDMNSREKFRALAARDRAYEGGHFLGNPLDAKECRSLLRLSEWKAYAE